MTIVRQPYHQDEGLTLHHGDALEVARTLASGSVDCIVTSPPYYGLRDYGHEGQYGLEETPAAYVETMRALFSELRRVLADDGTLWLNIGDSYGKGKQLIGIPWLVAHALQADGWILRNDIIWAKTNPMPTSVTDRVSNTYEHIFLISKSASYSFDLDSIREPYATSSVERYKYAFSLSGPSRAGGANVTERVSGTALNHRGKNPGDVWSVGPKPFKGAHFAVMPPEIARRAVVAGCKPGGTVLDPFSGSGTTGLVARESGRDYIGIDISADYLQLSMETRFKGQDAA